MDKGNEKGSTGRSSVAFQPRLQPVNNLRMTRSSMELEEKSFHFVSEGSTFLINPVTRLQITFPYVISHRKYVKNVNRSRNNKSRSNPRKRYTTHDGRSKDKAISVTSKVP